MTQLRSLLVGSLFISGFLFVPALIGSVPLLVVVRLARTRLSINTARALVALGMLVVGGLWWYQAEWFDVFRHGNPGLRYWLNTLPLALAVAAAGASLGGTVARSEPRTSVTV